MGASVFCTDYWTQVVYCAIFGVTSGAYVGLTSVVLVDLLGLDMLGLDLLRRGWLGLGLMGMGLLSRRGG